MDFALSEEQRMFRDMFRNFAAKELVPVAERIDHEEVMPPEIVRKAVDQGFFGATLPEEYYGAALDHVSYVLLLEHLATACASLAVSIAAHVSQVAMSILGFGTDAQKEEWLPAMAAGEAIGAYALHEPDAGSNVMALETLARYESDEVVLEGVKHWVLNGQHAGLFLVLARGPEGPDAYLVPRATPDLTVGYREPTLGLRSAYFNTVYLEGCRIPAANRLGTPGRGADIARRAEDRMSIALGAVALGLAESSVDVAAQYATERVQFGVPIGKKQAIQNYVANAHAETEALRYLVYRAAWLADRGENFSVDASLVKAFSAQMSRSVTNWMLQVLGGYGFMEDYPMARKYRDARVLGIIGGTTEWHTFRVAHAIFAAKNLEITP